MISCNRILSLGNGTSHYDIVTADLIGISRCHDSFLISNCNTSWTNPWCQTDKIWIGSLLDDLYFLSRANNTIQASFSCLLGIVNHRLLQTGLDILKLLHLSF
ncbi:Uncharacterised protein [Mycobacterium tuberculosis]|nr:Uncharacterised protein [Mycobacterium tuberculosis]